MMRDTYEAILRLKALRSFEDRPVSDDDMDAVLEAARWTGSSKNRQNWSFIVVDDPIQRERLAGAGDFTAPIAAAPATICLVQEPEGYEFDTGRVAQNIMLAADALGLATCPITLHREEMAADILDLPDGVRCRYAIAIGHASAGAAPKRFGGRKPIAELVHRNTYGSTATF